MALAARDHLQDIGKKGLLSHKGSDGSNYKERIEKHCKWGGAIFEMIDYATRESAKDLVLALLVDDGVPHRINRNKLFDPVLTSVGVQYGPHKVAENCCVLVYAAQVVSHEQF